VDGWDRAMTNWKFDTTIQAPKGHRVALMVDAMWLTDVDGKNNKIIIYDGSTDDNKRKLLKLEGTTLPTKRIESTKNAMTIELQTAADTHTAFFNANIQCVCDDAKVACGGVGRCHEDGKCECPSGYSGDACESGGHCRCAQGFGGKLCDQSLAAALGGKVYALGGHDGSSWLNTAEVYDPTTKKWVAIAPMGSKRYLLAAVALGGKVYALGGCGAAGSSGSSFLNTAEVYDPTTNKWVGIPPMGSKRSGLAAVALGGKVYALGGYNLDSYYLNTAEVYDPNTNKWTTIASMGSKRDGVAAVAL